MTQANPFRTAADAARARGEHALARRISTEGRIAHKLVSHALESGYVISVDDGEEMTVKKSADAEQILSAMFSTDADTLIIRDPHVTDETGNMQRIGTVSLIYGNDGNDVISDYGAPNFDAFSAWIKPVEDFAEEA